MYTQETGLTVRVSNYNSACINNHNEKMVFNYKEVLVDFAVLMREGS